MIDSIAMSLFELLYLLIDRIAMSLFEFLYLLITAGAFTVVSVQLWLVLKQLRLAEGQARNQSHQAIYGHIQPIDMLLIQNPNLRALLYNNEVTPETLNPELLHQIEGVCEALSTTLENVVKQSTNAPGDILLGWQHYIHDLYTESVMLRWYMTRRETWYSVELRSIMAGNDNASASTESIGYR